MTIISIKFLIGVKLASRRITAVKWCCANDAVVEAAVAVVVSVREGGVHHDSSPGSVHHQTSSRAQAVVATHLGVNRAGSQH